MRDFYKLVQIDKTKNRFYVVCPQCGKRINGLSLPWICRNTDILETKKVPQIKQIIFNKKRVKATQDLVRQFNFCHYCGTWVCDDCFKIEDLDDHCKECEKKEEEE